MQLIDWALVLLSLAGIAAIALYTRRFNRSVVEFVAGGRCAGRYLLANARGEADSGLSNTMAKFESIMVSGFVLGFWSQLSVPIILLVGISGFVVYRFRETRAMTLAQFLEMRYSRRFRLFMGALAFLSGILNYGVFPAISSRFFIYFLDLPDYFHIGPIAVSTFGLIMFLYLSATVWLVLIGGQVTTMVTACIEGLFSHLFYVVIAIVLLSIVKWPQVVEWASSASKGHSLIDPFNAGKQKDFNFAYVVMSLVLTIYTTMALQNRQGFNAAARTPHESRMGGVLGNWRGYARSLMLLVLGLCAMTYMKHPAFFAASAPARAAVDSIQDRYIQQQMTVPIALRYLLPVGFKGLFCATMVMGLLAGDAGHIHSWGSIFVQDIVLPLRKTTMSPRMHIWMLRAAVLFVAAFAFTFSMVFSQSQYIALWWAVTGGVFTGGAGAAIIGGLYWNRGTATAAWAAAITGSVLSFVGITLSGSLWDDVARAISPHLVNFGVRALPAEFWFNGQETAFYAAAIASAVYVVVSLVLPGDKFDLDRMLHRGKYAVERSGVAPPASIRERFRLHHVLRFDKAFTRADKFVAAGIFVFSMLMVVVNLLICLQNWTGKPWGISAWANYWYITGILIPMVIAIITLVWFTIGGVKDTKQLFFDLSNMKEDGRDDGRVVGDHNLADEPSKVTRLAAAANAGTADPIQPGSALLQAAVIPTREGGQA